MTLTELKYIVAVARERHFGRAAEQCFVSQPTLSVAIKKFEEELNITLFERGSSEISVTPIGAQIIEQAQKVLDQAANLKEMAKVGKDPLAGPLRLGIIYTIGPYLLPHLVKKMIHDAPQMPLILQENFTVKLLELLRLGEIDVAILAEPFSQTGLVTQALYDEPFIVALPKAHEWSKRKSVSAEELKKQTMLLLGAGHCFRDHVLEVCPELSRFSQSSEGIQRSFEGSSLETIRHMVASGIGITVLPMMATPNLPEDELLRYLPFQGEPPSRRIVLAWRKSFTRAAAIEMVRNAVLSLPLTAIKKLPSERAQFHPH
jgi:LysR family transcriptional regulator, hydrogen peroxide-inducible genes activator